MKDDLKFNIIKESNELIYKNPEIIKNKIEPKISIKEEKYNKYSTATSFSSLFSSTPSRTQTQSTTPNATNRWSPVSFAGKIYEWNRGVIGVSPTVEVEKENLDGTSNHHSDATVRIVNALGGNIEYENLPFQKGVEGSEQGILVFQSEGDKGLFYFPSSLTNEQIIELGNIISPRTSFEFSFAYNGEVYDEQNVRDVIAFAMNISSLSSAMRR